MRLREITISEDDLDRLLATKGLDHTSSSVAQQYADALGAEDDIGQLANGTIDSKVFKARNQAPAQSQPVTVGKTAITTLPSLPPLQSPVAKPSKNTLPRVSAPTQAAGSVPWQDIAHYCKSKYKMSKNHIAGILANIKAESQFMSHDLHMDSNGLPAGGLFSHNGPRLNQLMKKLGPNWKSNWRGQIDFALAEPDGARYMAKSFSSADSASKAWTIGFERPAKAKIQAVKRAPAAVSYATNM